MIVSQGRTFGTIGVVTTNQKGGFTSAGEKTVTIGSTKPIKKKNILYNNKSLAELAYLELLKKYQR